MTGLASPDVSAYISYLIVLVCGGVVARARVSGLLQAYEDRWAFAATWLVFFAYVAIPVALFWFLDYTNAIHDTSIFAALLVAVGYQQVFAGGVEGIAMPGQSTALWKPFEAWVSKVADRIETLNKRYLDRFDEQVRSSIASEPANINKLHKLVEDRTRDLEALKKDLDEARTDWQTVDILWRKFRASEPERYGLIARSAELVSRWLYFRWQQKGEGKLMTAGVMLVIGALAFYGWSRLGDPETSRAFYKWRLFKTNATDRDRFRTREYYAALLQPGDAASTTVLASLVPELSYSALSTQRADDCLRLVIDCHSPSNDRATLNLLVEVLRTANPDVRARVQAAMVHLASASFAACPLDESLKTWAPSKDDSPGVIDTRVAGWRKWLGP